MRKIRKIRSMDKLAPPPAVAYVRMVSITLTVTMKPSSLFHADERYM